MAFLIYIAAMALLVLAIAHSYLGERYILIRLFKRDNCGKLVQFSTTRLSQVILILTPRSAL